MNNVINRIIGKVIESNVVYPIDGGKYRLIARLDAKWVAQQLRMRFRVDYINNKYAIVITVYDNIEQIWYQHDDKTWLIEPAKG